MRGFAGARPGFVGGGSWVSVALLLTFRFLPSFLLSFDFLSLR
jgi:hypothetical protein